MGERVSTDPATDSFLDLIHSHLRSAAASDDEERVARIAEEAVRAFRSLAHVRRAVSIFGSAQEPPASRWGRLARETAAGLAREGFAVMTGGGPGLMAVASAAAGAAGVQSIGLTIQLAIPEPRTEFLTLEVPFRYFFLRKLAFVKYSCAFVCLPGGFGTLDELFEALNLKRTQKLAPFPVLLIGSDYWLGLYNWMRGEAVRHGCLARADLDLMELVDDPGEVVARVVECHRTLCRQLGIT